MPYLDYQIVTCNASTAENQFLVVPEHGLDQSICLAPGPKAPSGSHPDRETIVPCALNRALPGQSHLPDLPHRHALSANAQAPCARFAYSEDEKTCDRSSSVT